MDWLWGALAGFSLGAIAGPLVEPWRRRLERWGRRAAREKPVDVHVEWDQAQVWAGVPPWVSFSNYFEDQLPREDPPSDGKAWSAWAERNGGYDLRLTMLVVTVVARTGATVVVDTPRVSATRKEVPPGVGVLWPAPGGADISPRRYDIDLSAGSHPWVYFRDGHATRGAQRHPAPGQQRAGRNGHTIEEEQSSLHHQRSQMRLRHDPTKGSGCSILAVIAVLRHGSFGSTTANSAKPTR